MKKTKTKYYEISNNKLVIKHRDKKAVILGRFTLTQKNNLVYRISKPAFWKRKYSIAPNINFQGKWDVDKNHDLVFNINKSGVKIKQKKIYFKSQLKRFDHNSIVFAVSQKLHNNTKKVDLFKIKGKWQLDKKNQLSFLVQKSKSTYQPLTLKGQWSIKNNLIYYKYKESSLVKRKKKEKELVLKGVWQIGSNRKLNYCFNGSKNKKIIFKITNIKNSIKTHSNKIDIILETALQNTKKIVLTGQWQVKNKRRFTFNVNYGKNKIPTIGFNAEFFIGQNNTVVFKALTAKRRKTDLSIELKKDFFKRSAKLFIKGAKRSKRKSLKAGITIRF